MNLEATVMNMWLCCIRREADQENGMMVNKLLTTVNVCKHGDVLWFAVSARDIEHIAGHQIEVLGVE